MGTRGGETACWLGLVFYGSGDGDMCTRTHTHAGAQSRLTVGDSVPLLARSEMLAESPTKTSLQGAWMRV